MMDFVKMLIDKSIRHGGTFRKILGQLDASEYLSAEELEELQNLKLRKLVKHSVENVPYYEEMFKSLGLTPDDIRTKEDLQKLPFIDKKIVRSNFDKFLARNMGKTFAAKAETSGSTGEPALFLRDYYSINFESAALWRFRRQAGGNNVRKIILRGDVVVPVDRNDPPFWRHNPYSRELLMSSYHLSEKNAASYIDRIMRFRPDIIYGFPSSIYQLAKLILNHGVDIRLKAVYTSSESISQYQREFLEKVFSCRVFDWYGQVERVSAIGQCEKGTYHIIEDYSITELVETDGGIEIVGTNLNNYIMPMIRFRTADTVTISDKQCGCGRSFRTVEKINGRGLNYIYGPDGNKLSLFLASDCIDYEDNVSEVQFVQVKKGELIVNLVKAENFSEKDRLKIIRSIKDHTCPAMSVIINEVDNILRSDNGKVINVIIDIHEEEQV